MKVEFHQKAISELNAAVDYYEERSYGLGIAFLKEIQAGIEIIKEYPESWQKLSLSTRRFLIKQFPYGIIYMVHKEVLYIIAVMHLNRKPGYWEKRK
jgi:plasmid stabilization system protein ParE